MRRIRTEFDPEIEAKGWDKIRSRVEVTLKDDQKIVREADERYRGGPDHPLSDAELQSKFIDCTEQLLSGDVREKIFETVAGLEKLKTMAELMALVQTTM